MGIYNANIILDMDMQTRLQIIKLFYANESSPILTLGAYNKLISSNHSTITVHTISALVKNFEETFSLHDKPRSGRPSLVEERKDLVMESL